MDLYVLNSGEGTVSVIDTERHIETKRIDLDIRVPRRRGAFVAPREAVGFGDRIYILCPFDDLLICCDRDMDEIIYCRSVPCNPVRAVLSEDGKYVYVACADSDCIMQLSAGTGRQLTMVRTRPYPVDIMLDSFLLCACLNGRCVTAYAPESLIPLNTLALKGMPFSMAGRSGVALSQLTCNDGMDGCLSLIRPEGPICEKNIRLNMVPGRICETDDGYALAENGGERLKFYNYYLECVGEVDAGGVIDGMIYNGAQNLLYVSLPGDNSVTAYDCATLSLCAQMQVGLEPGGMIIVDRSARPE